MAKWCESRYVHRTDTRRIVSLKWLNRLKRSTMRHIHTHMHTLMRVFKIYFDGAFRFYMLHMRTPYTYLVYFHHGRIRRIFRITFYHFIMEIMSVVISGPTCIDINYDIDRRFNGGGECRNHDTIHPIHSPLFPLSPSPLLSSLALMLPFCASLPLCLPSFPILLFIVFSLHCPLVVFAFICFHFQHFFYTRVGCQTRRLLDVYWCGLVYTLCHVHLYILNGQKLVL